jgi:hypothetical protein
VRWRPTVFSSTSLEAVEKFLQTYAERRAVLVSIDNTQLAAAHTSRGNVLVHWIVGINQLMAGSRPVLISIESTSRWWRTSAYRNGRVHLMVL